LYSSSIHHRYFPFCSVTKKKFTIAIDKIKKNVESEINKSRALENERKVVPKKKRGEDARDLSIMSFQNWSPSEADNLFTG